MTESPLVDSSFAVPIFSPRDDQISCLNKAMTFLTAVASSKFPSTNNQLRTSSNPRDQATIQDGRNATWYKDKAMLAEAQEAGQVLDEEQLAFLTEDLDTYDSDCVDISNAKAILMANIFNYGSDVISEKAQQIKPTLYDGIVISSKHVAMPVIDDEETLILKEESRSKMAEKDKEPEVIKPKISNKLIDYVKLNKLYKDFGKCFVPQQELLADETLWYYMLNPSTKSSDALLVKIEAPKKLPKIVLWYLDSRCSKHMSGNRSQLMNFVSKFLGTVRFGNDHIARIMGFGDYQLGNVTISRVYYVEGLGHNLCSVGQFCDADLEVAFQKNTCFIRNLEGVDLLFGSRDTNLYTNCLDDMLKTSPIYLQSKASKTKSWLWHPLVITSQL
nr:integrase, catalytic region, zinc finger, CCHC-type, peptidase aspartic, catalytic [Tanacetum cinerariifolium]